jgi:hypothetical protein
VDTGHNFLIGTDRSNDLLQLLTFFLLPILTTLPFLILVFRDFFEGLTE